MLKCLVPKVGSTFLALPVSSICRFQGQKDWKQGWRPVCATYILDPPVHHGLRITVLKCFKTSEMSLFPTLSVTAEIKGDQPRDVCSVSLNG